VSDHEESRAFDFVDDCGDPLTSEQLTDLVRRLAWKWPELWLCGNEDGEIVDVVPAEGPRPRGRPPKSSTVFKDARKLMANAAKEAKKRRFRDEDAAKVRRGLRSLQARADDEGIELDAYRLRLNRARKPASKQPRDNNPR
jgi:hypothetical protein